MRCCSCQENIKFTSSSYRVTFFSLYRHTDDGGFWRFSEDFRPLSKDFRRFSKTCPKVNFPKITEECRRISRKNRRYFDDKPTTNLISVKSSIFSIVRISKIRQPSPGCGFVWILSGLHTANLSWQTRVGNLKLVCVNGTKTVGKHVGKLLATNRTCLYSRQHFHQLFRVG